MAEAEPQSAGAQANAEFVTKMRAEHPELQDQIPVDCKDCSTAWQQALRGRADRLQGCQGHFEETIPSQATDLAKFTVMLCHLP
jgi:hypothetical protein